MGLQNAAGEPSWPTDAAAFARMVRRWQQPIARFLLRVVNDADRVPDLTQDVFLRVFQARDRYRHTDHFSTWLFQIALNVGRDALRRHKPWVPIEDNDARADVEPPDVCAHRELAALMAKAIAELPINLREVIALRHDHDMSFAQMARVLDTPASTLKSRFAIAMNRLRDRLAALQPSEELP